MEGITDMFSTSRSAQTLFAGLGLTTILTLSACGSGSDNNAGTQVTPGGGGSTGSAANSDQLVAYAQCLRGQGVDVPDPKPGQNLGTWLQQSGLDLNKLRGANAACQDKLLAGVRSRANSSDTQDNLLKFAQCMRKNGVDMPDPKNGQVDFGNLDRNSPKFKAASDECRKALAPGASGQ
jgi:hypothetical protein